jgi:hypothetical protein
VSLNFACSETSNASVVAGIKRRLARSTARIVSAAPPRLAPSDALARLPRPRLRRPLAGARGAGDAPIPPSRSLRRPKQALTLTGWAEPDARRLCRPSKRLVGLVFPLLDLTIQSISHHYTLQRATPDHSQYH